MMMSTNDRRYDFSVPFRTRDDWRLDLCKDCRRPFADGEVIHIFEPHNRYRAHTHHCEPCARKRGMTTIELMEG
jgi:hypothetical protein